MARPPAPVCKAVRRPLGVQSDRRGGLHIRPMTHRMHLRQAHFRRGRCPHRPLRAEPLDPGANRDPVRWFRKSISHSRGNGNFFSRNGKNGLDRRCGLWYNGFTCEKGLIFFALFLPGQFNLSPRLRQGGKIKEVPNMRVKITLRCSECKQRNYNTMKNKKNDPDRLEMKKYCRFCKKHTVHNETK